MHEMSIAQSIFDIVHEEMLRHKVQKLEAINIAVGKLSAVVPSSLTFCFQILTEGTDMAGVVLNVKTIPLGYHCFDCGHEFTSEEMTFTCPHCGADQPMLTSGKDLNIESIEVAEN